MATAVAVLVIGVVVINRRVLPTAVRTAERRLAEDAGIRLSVVDARYRPFDGLRLLKIELKPATEAVHAPDVRTPKVPSPLGPDSRPSPSSSSSLGAVARLAPSARLTIGTARIPVSIPTIRRLQRGLREPPSGIWSALAMLPQAVELSAVRIDGLEGLLGTEANVGAEQVRIEHPGEEAGISIRGGGESGGNDAGAASLGADLDIDYRAGRVDGNVEVRSLPFRRGFARNGIARASLSIAYIESGASRLGGTVSITDLFLDVPLLSSQIVGPVSAAYRFDAVVEDGVSITAGELQLGEVAVSLEPTLRPRPGTSVRDATSLDWIDTVHVELSVDETSVADIAAAIPAELLGPLSDAELAGSLRWDFAVTVPISEVGDLEWTSDAAVESFTVTAISEAVNPFILNEAFVYRLGGATGDEGRVVRIPEATRASMEFMLEHTEHSRRQIDRWRVRAASPAAKPRALASPSSRVWTDGDPSAPEPDPSYRFVRLEEVSPWVIRAVLTAEDGDFFFHDGVNYLTLVDAVERNLREGEVILGASTITMQLAKMLFLDGERTLSRKLQEVFLVYLMEEVVPVPKERILELYINIVELGPDIYGVAEAADYYFAKDPGELDAGEAMWLASILPSPNRYHRYYESGEISPGWFIRMQSYFDIMLERGRMTEEEHAAASQAPPDFAFPGERPGD